MKRLALLGLLVAFMAAAAGAAYALSAKGGKSLKASLQGYSEVPSNSTVATGSFKATIDDSAKTISYTLSYTGLEGTGSAAHIHLGQAGVAGGIAAFLCGGGGKPACPATAGTVTGTIVAADVIGPVPQGIAAGEWDELAKAIRAGFTYTNVHSSKFPGGEIRGQIGGGKHEGHDRAR